MKTPREILDENDLTGKLKCYDYEGNPRDYFDITYAMKEYAKMWIKESLKHEPDSYIEDYLKQIDAQ